MRKRAIAQKKRRWADKTAFNILVFERLAQLFPDAQFIHLVRDGRDVAASLLERKWRSPTGALFEQCASVTGAARYWSAIVTRGLAAEKVLSSSSRILRVRYEDLAADPADTLQSVCRFLGEEVEPEALKIENRRPALAGLELETADRLHRPINAGAVGRWLRDLDPVQAATAFYPFRPQLAELGYRVE
jgi:hypothetical protein